MKGSWRTWNWEGSVKGGRTHTEYTLSRLSSLEKKGFLQSLYLFLWHSQPRWVKIVLVGLWSPGALASGKLSLQLGFRIYPMSLGLFCHQPLKQVVLGSSLDIAHCKIWRLALFIYQHLPLQVADLFPFLQMALMGQPKKALLAICFLLPFQAG